jgi:uncharacterized OB-fold protein
MILEGDITIPYKWTTGEATGRFLAELRDNARIVGGRCRQCGRVYLPPPDVCGDCFKPVSDLVALSGRGTVVAASTVHRRMPFSPAEAPYTIALIRLDGADTEIVHLVCEGVKSGDRVIARFKQERAGSILDIECFAPIS